MGLWRGRDEALRRRCHLALLELSAERGYATLDPPAVIERAGLDRTEWRRLYFDLEDCACELLVALRDEFVLDVTAAALPQPSWREQIRAAAYSILEYFLADDARARFMLIEIAAVGERAVLIRDQGMDAMITMIDLGRAELDDPASLGRSTAAAIAGAVFDRMRQIVAAGSDPGEARRMVPEMLYAVFLPVSRRGHGDEGAADPRSSQ